MRLYLSGPMSGRAGFNIPAFDRAAERLRLLGYEIVSPAELDKPEFRQVCLESDGTNADLVRKCTERGLVPETWGYLLARDIKLLADEDIEGIAVLAGWATSRGALLETFAGRMMSLGIYRYQPHDRPAVKLMDDHTLKQAHARGIVIYPEHTPPSAAGCPSLPEPSYVIQEKGEGGGITTRKAPIISKTHSEVRVVDEDTGGEKGEKPEAFDLLPWPALAEVAKVYAFGAKKYQPNNWRKGFRWGLCFASKIRHAMAFWGGQSIDPETQCHHLASDVFHSLTLMEFERAKLGKDDRALHH